MAHSVSETERLKDLVKEIYSAFEKEPYPGDASILRTVDRSDPERQAVASALKGRAWQEVPFEVLDDLEAAIFYLTPEGYRYYLPAFLVYVLTDYRRADVIANDVVRSLTYPMESDAAELDEAARRYLDTPFLNSPEWAGAAKSMRDRYESGAAREDFMARVSGFTDRQSAAIRHFLEYFDDVHADDFPMGEPRQALARYWRPDDG